MCQTKMFGQQIPQESCVVCGGTGTTDGIKQTTGLALNNIREFMDFAKSKIQEWQQGHQNGNEAAPQEAQVAQDRSFEDEFGDLDLSSDDPFA